MYNNFGRGVVQGNRTALISFILVFLFFFTGYDANCLKAFAQEASIFKDTGEETDLQYEYDEWIDDLEEDESVPQVRDPLERFNRCIFAFNDFFYFKALKPVARGYRFITPEPVRVRVKNFFYNIGFPVRFVNNILQIKFKRAGQDTCQFVFNSTVGILGFFNPAQKYPWLNPPPEDTGQTLGTWGVGNGFYIVLPMLGPSTLRDSVGIVSDYFLQPVSYIEPVYISLGARSYEIVNKTSLSIGEYESLKESAFDPYIAFKDAYIQYREKAIHE
ncbi:MAG: VacJ family lipoprotein [Deltaproteobacteria bacterium]|nr:MAG: VacJ family lipoprotein [Deltaproteobacteria bacterium]